MKHLCACPVYRNARKFGRAPAIFAPGQVISYREFHSAVCKVQQKIKSLGIKADDHIAVVAGNSAEYLVILFALWRIKAIACLLNPRLPIQALSIQVRSARCAVLLTDIKDILTSDRIKIPKLEFHEVCPRAAAPKIHHADTGGMPIEYDLAQRATVMFTSGSCGVPKPAVHKWGNHYYSALGANEHIPFLKKDLWLLSLPLYHVAGMGIIFRVFLGGGAVVIPDNKNDLIKAIVKNRVTHISLVPTQLYRLLRDAKNVGILRGLKAILIGGSAIPDTVMREAMDAGLPVYVSYGLTEMASQVATSDRLSSENHFRGARVLNYRQVKISDEGEILVKGQTLFEGYWEGEGLRRPWDKEGWFATGDLGSLGGDGTLTVSGRRDTMFICGGENIHPEEIERHLCQIDGIVQAIVVPVEDEEFGARPAAFIQTTKEMRLSKKEILTSLRDRLPSFKVPVQIHTWPAIVRTGIKPNRSHFIRLMRNENQFKNDVKKITSFR
jgi:O-succinylbenzoic acid--CoA ligase